MTSVAARRQPLVSKRISIAWPPTIAAHEPTDTLVLTGSSYFLDLRIYLPSHPADASSGQEQPPITEPKLEWALAGTKTFLEDSTEDNPKARWDYIINSHNTSGGETAQPDVGSMTTLPNGDVKEVGSMFNPDVGTIMEYEEVWRDLEVPTGSLVCFLESQGAPLSLVGRIGPWQLAVLEDVEGGCLARRDEMDVDGTWGEVYCVGGKRARAGLPGLLEDELIAGWKEGEQVTWMGRQWAVRELSVATCSA